MSSGSQAPPPVFREQQTSYMERYNKNLTSGVLSWIDESNDDVWPAGTSFADTDWMTAQFTFVMRTNTIEIYDRAGLGSSQSVGVAAKMFKLGNTSWRATFEICRVIGGEQREALARVWNTCVMVDRAKLRPMKISDKDKAFMRPVAERNSEVTPSDNHIPRADNLAAAQPPAFVWNTVVRTTDCDMLGHLNNTRYAVMAEEALGVAVSRRSFEHFYPEEPWIHQLAKSPTVSMHIEYIDQLLPFEPLEVAIVFDRPLHAFVLRLYQHGTLASLITTSCGTSVMPSASANKQSTTSSKL